MAVSACELTVKQVLIFLGEVTEFCWLTGVSKSLEGRLGMTLKSESLGRTALKDANSRTYLEAEFGS